ncbi:hypothetical protein E2C01_079745 [Portunus trituberculatus]|uniref:Uncharacterized protein n=1 Tax=Portunus trituberculatus TaxID=210409 RepID=A0A5B7IU55_PORTR|nr:hypothetical protein [Portunus trituberculatus]
MLGLRSIRPLYPLPSSPFPSLLSPPVPSSTLLFSPRVAVDLFHTPAHLRLYLPHTCRFITRISNTSHYYYHTCPSHTIGWLNFCYTYPFITFASHESLIIPASHTSARLLGYIQGKVVIELLIVKLHLSSSLPSKNSSFTSHNL